MYQMLFLYFSRLLYSLLFPNSLRHILNTRCLSEALGKMEVYVIRSGSNGLKLPLYFDTRLAVNSEGKYFNKFSNTNSEPVALKLGVKNVM